MSLRDEVKLLQKKVAELERIVDVLLCGRSDLERREVSIEKPVQALSSENWDG
jgi:hypothetical protein